MAATPRTLSFTTAYTGSSQSVNIEDKIGAGKQRHRSLFLKNLSDNLCTVSLFNETAVPYAEDMLHLPGWSYLEVRWIPSCSFLGTTGYLEISGEAF